MNDLPAKFGKYTLIRKLATGGMAELHLAIQKSISGFEKLIVIKKILPKYARDEEFIKMFLDEAKIAATLNHPNIVQIYDVGSVGNDYFIAMEYIHGEDLRNIVGAMRQKEMSRFPMEYALAIIMGVCKGLSYAHDHRGLSGEPLNIVHRDISPQNIIVTFNGEVKVVDFGIARAAVKGSKVDGKEGGALRGKFPYMSPEQIKGLELDRRSDIFSTGIILFELTTGRRLFKGKNEIDTLRKIVDLQYPRPSQFIGNYPPDLEKVVMKALQKDRDLRYQSALEMLQDIEDFIRNRKLKVSTIELGKFMETLFKEKLEEEKEALKEGKKLADIIEEKEASDVSFEELLDLSTLPSTFGTTSKAMVAEGSAVSSILATPQVQKKKRNYLFYLLGVTVLTAIVITLGFFSLQFYKSRQEAKLLIGKVKIKTAPPGAAVYVDGEKYPGETPLVVERLKPDIRYTIKVTMDGYQPEKREVSVTKEAAMMELNFKLKPIKSSAMAVLKIVASNDEAVFFLDGKKLEGKGTVTIDMVIPGVPHTIFIQAPYCVDHTEKIILKPGEVREIKVELKPKPLGKDEFILALNTDPPGASVLLDGKKLEGTTPERWRLKWKKYFQLIIEKDRYRRKKIELNPPRGKTIEITQKLDKRKTESSGSSASSTQGAAVGTLYLDSVPWSNVTIQGVGRFQTPIANLKVPAGTLRVKLENPLSGVKKIITIKIKPGQTIRKKVQLK